MLNRIRNTMQSVTVFGFTESQVSPIYARFAMVHKRRKITQIFELKINLPLIRVKDHWYKTSTTLRMFIIIKIRKFQNYDRVSYLTEWILHLEVGTETRLLSLPEGMLFFVRSPWSICYYGIWKWTNNLKNNFNVGKKHIHNPNKKS